MKKILMLIFVLALTACENPRGMFTVSNEMKLKKKKYLFFGSKEIKIPVGSYNAKIAIKSKRKFKFEINDLNGSAVKRFTFKVPKGIELPTGRGDIFLTSNQVKQPYDVYVVVDAEYSSSEIYGGYEFCTKTIRRRVCRDICRIVNGRYVCHQECYYEETTYRGNRHVRYHYNYTDKTFTVELQGPGTGVAHGTFNGTDRDTDKIYDHYGYCY